MTDLFANAGVVLAALAEPFTNPASRTFVAWLVLDLVLAVAFLAWSGRRLADAVRDALAPEAWTHRSTRVDVQMLVTWRLLGVLGAIPQIGSAYVLAVAIARGLDRLLFVPDVPQVPVALLSVAWTAVLFVAWDASRFALHYAAHAFRPLWAIHQVHHSAEVLTPLTFHRVHPIEALLFELRGVAVSGTLAGIAFWSFRHSPVEVTFLGVNALGLAFNALMGNLRHSQVWMAFPPAVERWLLSPAQHQLHHGVAAAEQRTNYGTWLACWDRLAGTLALSPARPPAAYGVAPGERNHDPHDLLSALLAPVVAAARGRAR